MIAGKPCPRCAAAPCPHVRDSRRLFAAWEAERRRQMDECDHRRGEPTPDQKAMADALPTDLFNEPCACACHDKEAK